MHHAGELTKSEKAILKAILHKLGWSNLLVRRNYEAATGTTVGKALPSRVNLVTGEVA